MCHALSGAWGESWPPMWSILIPGLFLLPPPCRSSIIIMDSSQGRWDPIRPYRACWSTEAYLKRAILIFLVRTEGNFASKCWRNSVFKLARFVLDASIKANCAFLILWVNDEFRRYIYSFLRQNSRVMFQKFIILIMSKFFLRLFWLHRWGKYTNGVCLQEGFNEEVCQPCWFFFSSRLNF